MDKNFKNITFLFIFSMLFASTSLLKPTQLVNKPSTLEEAILKDPVFRADFVSLVNQYNKKHPVISEKEIVDLNIKKLSKAGLREKLYDFSVGVFLGAIDSNVLLGVTPGKILSLGAGKVLLEICKYRPNVVLKNYKKNPLKLVRSAYKNRFLIAGYIAGYSSYKFWPMLRDAWLIQNAACSN